MAALLALFVAGGLRRGAPPEAAPATATLELVSRGHQPWVYYQGPDPVGVVFEMESSARREVIGVAEAASTRQALALDGWLGDGPVTIHARPSKGGPGPRLVVRPAEVEDYLDVLADRVLAGDRGEAWRTLGSFASVYFADGVGSLEPKRRVQELLVDGGPAAGPGGAAWLWGETFAPRRASALVGARELEGIEREGTHLAPGPEGAAWFDLPRVPPDSMVEACGIFEVSPTPAPRYHVRGVLASGYAFRLEPGPLGGLACQRLDVRAFGGAEGGVRLELRSSAPDPDLPDLRADAARFFLRFLPAAAPEGRRHAP